MTFGLFYFLAILCLESVAHILTLSSRKSSHIKPLQAQLNQLDFAVSIIYMFLILFHTNRWLTSSALTQLLKSILTEHLLTYNLISGEVFLLDTQNCRIFCCFFQHAVVPK